MPFEPIRSIAAERLTLRPWPSATCRTCWNVPDGRQWEMLTVSYARAAK